MHAICKLGDNLHTIMIFRNGRFNISRDRPEFVRYIQHFYFSINLKLVGLNNRKDMGTQKDIKGVRVFFI